MRTFQSSKSVFVIANTRVPSSYHSRGTNDCPGKPATLVPAYLTQETLDFCRDLRGRSPALALQVQSSKATCTRSTTPVCSRVVQTLSSSTTQWYSAGRSLLVRRNPTSEIFGFYVFAFCIASANFTASATLFSAAVLFTLACLDLRVSVDLGPVLPNKPDVSMASSAIPN